MSLRERLIEAGAEAAFNSIHSDPTTVAESHLDVFLDTLAENLDEWMVGVEAGASFDDAVVELIAALREET